MIVRFNDHRPPSIPKGILSYLKRGRNKMSNWIWWFIRIGSVQVQWYCITNRVYKIITVIIITLEVVRLIRGRGWSGRAGL